jgi:hypothetical protein
VKAYSSQHEPFPLHILTELGKSESRLALGWTSTYFNNTVTKYVDGLQFQHLLYSYNYYHIDNLWYISNVAKAANLHKIVQQSAATCSPRFLARGFLYSEDGGYTFLRTSVHTRSTRRHIPEDGILLTEGSIKAGDKSASENACLSDCLHQRFSYVILSVHLYV